MSGENPTLGETDQRVALVTGASSGIGLATAKLFFKQGWKVALVGRSSERLQLAARAIDLNVGEIEVTAKVGEADSVLDSTVATIELQTPRILAITVPKLCESSIQEMIAAVLAQWGRLDLIVASAGVAPLSPLEKLTSSELEETFDVNCASLFHLAKSCLEPFRSQGSGTIIYISSLSAIDPFPGFSLYGASKAWGTLFVQAIAGELKELGSSAFAICPGAVETPLLRSLFPDFPTNQTLSPDRIAELIERLVESDSGYPSGSAISVVKEEGSMVERLIQWSQTVIN